MNTAVAFELLEKGEACCVCASLLILRVGNRYYISYDGCEWEETESAIIKKAIDE